MTEITVSQLQAYLERKYGDHELNDRFLISQSLFMKLVEEVGETAEALNKMAGRKKDDGQDSLDKELADIIHYTLAIASMQNIDLTKIIFEKDKIASVKYNQTPNLEEFIKSR